MSVAELVAHLAGDYVVQSDWMALEKVRSHVPAAAHAATYAACFLPLTRSPWRLAIIGGTHFVIDRWRLAKYVVWAKSQAAPAAYRYPWSHADGTGYHYPYAPGGHDGNPEGCTAPHMPPWLSTWLMIAADNTMHLLINRLALV